MAPINAFVVPQVNNLVSQVKYLVYLRPVTIFLPVFIPKEKFRNISEYCPYIYLVKYVNQALVNMFHIWNLTVHNVPKNAFAGNCEAQDTAAIIPHF